MKSIYKSQPPFESIREDFERHGCFFDTGEFARKYIIDGHAVTGIMLQSQDTREYDSERGASGRSDMIFLCRCSDVKNISVNNIVRIDGKAYYVIEAVRVQGLYWKIRLQVNE